MRRCWASDASRVETFADLGVRVIQLTYNPANSLGDGSMAPQNRGLTPFGREVVERLNAARLMVDLSHSGERTCLDAARASRAPISINHTGCRALVDLPRNKSDGELRLVASRGGFVGIYFMPFLNPGSVCTAADVVAHIEPCGERLRRGPCRHRHRRRHHRHRRHGRLPRRDARARSPSAAPPGSAPAARIPTRCPSRGVVSGPGQYRRLIALLEARGYPARRIEKIMGLNFVSFAREVWGG